MIARCGGVSESPLPTILAHAPATPDRRVSGAPPGTGGGLYLSDGVVNLAEERFDLALRTGPLADSRFRSRLLLPIAVWPALRPITGKGRTAGAPFRTEALPGTGLSWSAPEPGCSRMARSGCPCAYRAIAPRMMAVPSVSAYAAWAVLKSAMDVGMILPPVGESVLAGFGREINLYAVYPSAYLPPAGWSFSRIVFSSACAARRRPETLPSRPDVRI